MAAEWYVGVGNAAHGPISSEALKRLASDGKVTPDTFVKQGASGKWIPASAVKGLFGSATDHASPTNIVTKPAVPSGQPTPQTGSKGWWTALHAGFQGVRRFAIGTARQTDHLLLNMAGGPDNVILYRFLQLVVVCVLVGVMGLVGITCKQMAEEARIRAANQEVQRALERGEQWIHGGDLSDAEKVEKALNAAATNPAATEKGLVGATLTAFAKAKSERQAHKQQLAAYNQACSFFADHRYDQASGALAALIKSRDDNLSAKATQLKGACDLHITNERELPLSPIIEANSVAIGGFGRVEVKQGIVESISIRRRNQSPHSVAACEAIHLYNPTQDKVKPDVQVLILNKDGVILFQHSESWSLHTLDFGESYTVAVYGHMQFPRSLVFSKWAYIGWDIDPAYAICVGSKTSYDSLRQQLVQETNRVHRTPPSSINIAYDVPDMLPEAKAFRFHTVIPVSKSQIVESVTFSDSQVQISYFNRSDMRIKPNISGYVFNKDGVIIASFSDSWTFTSLSPGERASETRYLQFRVPDELVFSRWAAVAYDEKPAWFLIAGSSQQYSELEGRTEARLRALNTTSPLTE